MDRVFNFSAGPSMLPLSVLQKAQKEMLSYGSTGCSVMEMSHRSPQYMPIIEEAEASLRSLMNIPSNYAVLFLQGGATLQFSAIPFNLAMQGDTAAYALTGEFAQKAFTEAKRWLKPVAVASSEDKNFSYIPAIPASSIPPDAKYLHITVNNTIYGTMYKTLPQSSVPLVGDMSSIILGREYDVSQFGLIYAGAQKNMGIAGLTVVIADRGLLKETAPLVPPVMSYSVQDKNQSMANTPPTYAIYMAGLVFDWVKEMGGVKALQQINEEKSRLLYEAIDNSKLFKAPAQLAARSIVNIAFTAGTDQQTSDFLKMAESRGLVNLKGHRAVGGCRASIYNAMPIEGVKALIACMKDFEQGK